MTSRDPGGKVRIALPGHVKGSAVFGGPANEYRYRLLRTWGDGPRVMFVMMNPSTADPEFDDPTVFKCRRLAVKWGYGSMYVGNTFAYRATYQDDLVAIDDPIGPDNDSHLLQMAVESVMVVFAYGQPKHRRLKERGIAVARAMRASGVRLHSLRLAKNGTPSHPLYLPETLEPVIWEP